MERSLCPNLPHLSVPLLPAPLGLLPSHHHAGVWIYLGPQEGGPCHSETLCSIITA